MEGILLGVATSYHQLFNQANCAPKSKDGSTRKFQEWTLSNYIDVAAETGFLKQDVKKFSHVVRDFRNYIHPYSQLATKIQPDKQTALICTQVLKAAIYQIGNYRKRLQGGRLIMDKMRMESGRTYSGRMSLKSPRCSQTASRRRGTKTGI